VVVAGASPALGLGCGGGLFRACVWAWLALRAWVCGCCRELEGLLGGPGGGRGRPGLGAGGRSDEADPRTVYVGFLPPYVNDGELGSVFAGCGEVRGAAGLGRG
jgi:hypothetical protein